MSEELPNLVTLYRLKKATRQIACFFNLDVTVLFYKKNLIQEIPVTMCNAGSSALFLPLLASKNAVLQPSASGRKGSGTWDWEGGRDGERGLFFFTGSQSHTPAPRRSSQW